MIREKYLTINDSGNDLKFVIRQMPATVAFDFIVDAAIALADTEGAKFNMFDIYEVVEHLKKNGMASFRGVQKDKLDGLMARLMGCCSRVVENTEMKCTPSVLDGFVSDFKTIFTLYTEALMINFFQGEVENEKKSSFPEVVNIGKPQQKNKAC